MDCERQKLKLPGGYKVAHPENLFEGCEISQDSVIANVSADKIMDVMRHYIEMQEVPLFFVLHLPKKNPEEQDGDHFDTYFIDNCTGAEAEAILKTYGNWMIHDGLCDFGFGCLGEHYDEITAYGYGKIWISSDNISRYCDFYEAHGISIVERLTTADELDDAKEAKPYLLDGKDIYTLPELLRESGLYQWKAGNVPE